MALKSADFWANFRPKIYKNFLVSKSHIILPNLARNWPKIGRFSVRPNSLLCQKLLHLPFDRKFGRTSAEPKVWSITTSDLFWLEIWGDLVKISHGKQRTEREQIIIFCKILNSVPINRKMKILGNNRGLKGVAEKGRNRGWVVV